MMDILITNIDFPKGKEALALEVNRHGEVFVFYRDEASGRVAPLKRRESNAIEIPPHGRLIDADELEGILDEVNGYGGASEITYKKMIEILHDETLSPTVVEASNGSDN